MLIEYKNVNIYQQDTMVLSNVDFHVDEGEFIYIIGKVGSGKSSLLKTTYCELDLYQDEADKAEILGRNLLKLRRKDIPSLRKEMGIIFQDFQLLHDRTVYQNLLFVLKATGWKDKEKIKTRISEVLADVGMQDKADSMPHELSGGEQQRISIARALLNQPKVIIADEPTGNLDPETASSILQLLKDITATGTAIVMTTHNIPLIDKYPGIVYKCQDGKITDITKDYSHMCLEEE
ncbi:MAG: ATP-binding cassette domain-containing protein [Prevotella sp.]|uniref:cell division ATP-binding protein FtsE n=1 Tax=Prevotella sp. P3-122 TaxID=2024223 RepID=UPI000B95DE37|nr:ATP-binding cassette domain-containing protein [Prevotella sp. P3-122]MCI6180924.1 ATP-binding cassette domain-containing protein [Prevotella sp.]MCI6309082.1 ATP-binding cassette domain-containing protein [Prevotella sp.]MCI6554908.1 ATP-binding cassette domain-containing protein [Prevotella sp.]MCI7686887.1 ATP-binding cassette domain-containing protein [Prevotella sp.]MDD6590637.1 ATP-binding cassette domain-containing protein [Prevotella sp.]